MSVYSDTGRSSPNESNDLAKVLLEPNQKSNGLSYTKCKQRFTTDESGTFTKVLLVLIMVHRNCKLWEIMLCWISSK